MGISRFTFARAANGVVGPSTASFRIRKAIQSGNIRYNLVTLEEGQRLDQIAGKIYGDGSLWWVIAAASGIGWGMEVPPGVVLFVPVDAEEVITLLM